jgi:aspartate/tyrosine/aromatic aminotransferase
MLQNIKSRYNKNISSICTLCETGDEDIYHFLLVCSSLKSTWERHLQKIQEYIDSLRNGLYQDIQDADLAGPALDGLYKSKNKLWNSY